MDAEEMEILDRAMSALDDANIVDVAPRTAHEAELASALASAKDAIDELAFGGQGVSLAGHWCDNCNGRGVFGVHENQHLCRFCEGVGFIGLTSAQVREAEIREMEGLA